jgi:hypothetical protein
MDNSCKHAVGKKKVAEHMLSGFINIKCKEVGRLNTYFGK